MSQQNNNNGFLYFVVGALLVAVLGMGYMVYTDNSGTDDLAIIETSSGEEGGSDFNLEISDDGFKASAENDK